MKIPSTGPLFATGDLITWRSASQTGAWYIGMVCDRHWCRRGKHAGERYYTMRLLPSLRGNLLGEGLDSISESGLRHYEARRLTESEQRELEVRELVEAL